MYRLLPLLICLLVAVPAAGEELTRSVSVTGAASIAAEPDMARVNLAVEARDISLQTARDAVTRVSAAFLKLSRQLGIPDSKVQTTGLSLSPEYRWNPENRERELLGYMVQRQLAVELNDLELLGPLLEAAVDAGVNQVSPPQLDSSRRDDLHRQALAAAARDARANATALATPLGATVGPVRSLQAGETVPPPRPMMMRAEAMAVDSGGPTYQPGEIRIEARVNAVFDLLVQ